MEAKLGETCIFLHYYALRHFDIFSSNHPPTSKTSNVKHTKLIRNTNPLVIKDTQKMLYFLILKMIHVFQAPNMKINHLKLKITIQNTIMKKCNNTAQSKQTNKQINKHNTTLKLQEEKWDNGTEKKLSSNMCWLKILVTLQNLISVRCCMGILYNGFCYERNLNYFIRYCVQLR